MGKGKSGCGNGLGGQVELSGVNGSAFKVTPGLVDQAARQAYLNGQCAALAVALQELKGGQILAIGYDDSQERYEDWQARPSWGHLGLQLEDGSVIDIEGISGDLESWMERHQYWEVKELAPEEALSLPDFPEQNIGVARAMAETLVSQKQL